jgi:hypothetical protein
MPDDDPGRSIHHDVMYEARDLDASIIGWVAIGAVIVALLILGSVSLSYRYFARAEFRSVPPVTMVKAQPVAPQGPQLQVDPAGELETLRNQQEKTLSTYGWVDQQKGIVRIPIEEAMKRVVQKGLPPASKPSSVEGKKVVK